MKEKNLDQQFTENINPIMMAVNNCQNARFGKDWLTVKNYVAEIRGYIDSLDAIADEQLSVATR